MAGREGASIVAVSGYDCVRTVLRHGVLGAAKAAMEMLARQFAFELGPKGIRVNCVNFVYADTDSTRFFAGDGTRPAAGRTMRAGRRCAFATAGRRRRGDLVPVSDGRAS